MNANKIELSTLIGQKARWALESEVLLTPKPGLVDGDNTGSHTDLTLELMLTSAQTLESYFSQMALCAFDQPTSHSLRDELGRIGREAEAAMMQATGNINTHKGAIWSLGLLSAAAAQDISQMSDTHLCDRAKCIALMDDRQHNYVIEKDDKVRQQHRISGAKGEAQSGFLSVVNYGLPALWQSRRQGESETVARLNALVALMTVVDDTCVVSRSGISGLAFMKRVAQQILALGGAGIAAGMKRLMAFCDEMVSMNASPGGVADLFAAALFIDALSVDVTSFKAMPCNGMLIE